jgi:hypothetical protein
MGIHYRPFAVLRRSSGDGGVDRPGSGEQVGERNRFGTFDRPDTRKHDRETVNVVGRGCLGGRTPGDGVEECP